jgi:hypothetical protein
MRRVWRDRGLAVVLSALFLSSWAVQGWTGWEEFQADQRTHGQPAHFGGDDGYVWVFLESTFENWQSEFLQLLTFVVLTAYLIYRGSPESKDSDEEMKAMLEEVLERLDRMNGRAGGRT